MTIPLADGHTRVVTIRVDYHARRAATIDRVFEPWPGFPGIRQSSPTCSMLGGLFDLSTGPVSPATIRSVLTCHRVNVAWDQRLNGTAAIKITPVTPDPQLAATLWVSESTYLPIELTWRFTSGAYKGGGDDFYFSWLQPTHANLAQLTAPVPPGFKVVTVKD